MSDTTQSGLDVTSRNDVDLLHGKAVGLIGVLFLTLTGSAPISAMLFNVPIVIGNGNGFGAPAAFLVATVDILQWTGINVPWPILALAMIAGISVLTYFDVKLSTAILGVALVAEVAIL